MRQPPSSSGTSTNGRAPGGVGATVRRVAGQERQQFVRREREPAWRVGAKPPESAHLAFVRDHIDPEAVYRLEPSDLRMIDLAPLPRY